MTKVYFVRHAEPYYCVDDRSRPLTEEGIKDSDKVTEILKNIKVDYYLSSPYKRSVDTIKGSSMYHGISILTDERFRERENGQGGYSNEMIQKRWENFDYHEEGGESIRMVQSRNIEALNEILIKHKDKNIIIGTHGTALSTILNYYNPSFNYDSFMRIKNFMPYIIQINFDGLKFLQTEELLIVEKE